MKKGTQKIYANLNQADYNGYVTTLTILTATFLEEKIIGVYTIFSKTNSGFEKKSWLKEFEQQVMDNPWGHTSSDHVYIMDGFREIISEDIPELLKSVLNA